jgi:5-methyltetrahydropteroyltriglutamate--homocysteine methyltransferase
MSATQRSVDRLLTTHVGSLPRPDRLLEMMAARHAPDRPDPPGYDAAVTAAVAGCVRRQVECGIDIVTDGEQSKPVLRDRGGVLGGGR